MVGAGIIGTAIGARLAGAGAEVCVVDRAGPGAGTSSAGEGNLLASDKLPGPELEMAVRGIQLWRRLAEEAGDHFEFQPKGGLVVARTPVELEALSSLVGRQRQAGLDVEVVGPDDLLRLEPELSPGLLGGAFYEGDCQVQPMLAVAFHVAQLKALGGRVVSGAEVLGAERDGDGAVRSVETTLGRVAVGKWVVNAAGPWAGELARRLGSEVAVHPRRGYILVTEPLPLVVRHKVYEAGYVATVYGNTEQAACSAVVEATMSGTVLIGSSRELVGFSEHFDHAIAAEMASRAIALFPNLARARVIRAYMGFRPATPDGLPVIGVDPAMGNLVHATGHEGAGIGLAEVTAELVEALVRGTPAPLDLAPFAPTRFRGGTGRPALGTALPTGGTTSLTGGLTGGLTGATSRILTGASREAAGGLHGLPSASWPEDAGPGQLNFRFDGRRLTAPAGSTIAGALVRNGVWVFRRARAGASPHGLFCGIGTCFECLVDRNDESAVRACSALLREGDDVRPSRSVGLASSERRAHG